MSSTVSSRRGDSSLAPGGERCTAPMPAHREHGNTRSATATLHIPNTMRPNAAAQDAPEHETPPLTLHAREQVSLEVQQVPGRCLLGMGLVHLLDS